VVEILVAGLPEGAGPFPEVYDFSPSNTQALVGMVRGGGAGPRNLSVSDLWLAASLTPLEFQPLITAPQVAAARFSPDGSAVAYLLGTESTYELHHLDLASGEDRLLAVDVTPGFSFSPDGSELGFVRDPDWVGVGEGLGLFVVSTAGGPEQRVPFELAGLIGLSEPLYWTRDGQAVIVQARLDVTDDGFQKVFQIDRASSASHEIQFDPGLRGDFNPEVADPDLVVPILWAPDGSFFLTNYLAGLMTPDQMAWVLKYDLDEARENVIAITGVQQSAELVGWDVPGESIWVAPAPPGEGRVPFVLELP
jgi:hypothetical protein